MQQIQALVSEAAQAKADARQAQAEVERAQASGMESSDCFEKMKNLIEV